MAFKKSFETALTTSKIFSTWRGFLIKNWISERTGSAHLNNPSFTPGLRGQSDCLDYFHLRFAPGKVQAAFSDFCPRKNDISFTSQLTLLPCCFQQRQSQTPHGSNFLADPARLTTRLSQLGAFPRLEEIISPHPGPWILQVLTGNTGLQSLAPPTVIASTCCSLTIMLKNWALKRN